MKNIFYIISVLVIGAAAFFSWSNGEKIKAEIASFEKTEQTKITVEKNIAKTKGELEDTEGALADAEQLNSDLEAEKENELGKEGQFKRSLDKFQVAIEEADAELVKLAELEEKIKEKLGDLQWDQIPSKIQELKDDRKRKGDDLDQLIALTEKLEKELAKKQGDLTDKSGRLSEMRRRIALNSKVGAITVVDVDWGFVVVNLGSNNSNIVPESELLVTRGGRLLGRLKPNSVELNQTVCDLNIRDLTPGVRIQPGDRVTLAETASGG